MDLQELRYFYTVANEGSVLQAAHKLGYAQPNLSSKIKQLENEMGQSLFVRTSAGVSLTDKGKQLYAYAEKLLRLSDEAELAVKNEKMVVDDLCLGSMESAAVSFLPEILSAFHQKRPELNMKIRTAHSARLTEQVLRHELDGAFIAGSAGHEDLTSVPVKTEKMTLVADRSTPLDIGLETLLRRPLLVFPVGCTYRRMLENLLDQMDIVAHSIFDFNSLGAILASVSAGLGVSLLPENSVSAFVAGESLKCYSLPEPFDKALIRFIYRKESTGNLSLMAFVNEIDHLAL